MNYYNNLPEKHNKYLLDYTEKDRKEGFDCGVVDKSFPCDGKCCFKESSSAGAVYRKNCKYCIIWDAFPCGEKLTVTSIFECVMYGYGKRVKR